MEMDNITDHDCNEIYEYLCDPQRPTLSLETKEKLKNEMLSCRSDHESHEIKELENQLKSVSEHNKMLQIENKQQKKAMEASLKKQADHLVEIRVLKEELREHSEKIEAQSTIIKLLMKGQSVRDTFLVALNRKRNQLNTKDHNSCAST